MSPTNPLQMQSKDFWHAFRQALLMMVDAIERMLGINPTTAEIRNWYKLGRIKKPETAP